MPKFVSECPACGGALKIAVLRCPDCGMELHNDFSLSPFDALTAEQTDFLITFLRQRGNISALQTELGISYPTAKKRLENLLVALQLADDSEEVEEDLDMSNWSVPKDSHKASDIVKQKLMEHGGRAVVYTARGLPSEIKAAPDGISFVSDKLPISPAYQYSIFDVITELLIAQGGRARKGNGRNYKLGEKECDETTVVGAIAYQYAHKKTGDSVFDPVFVLAAILEWAGIAENGRGELILRPEYRSML